MNYNIIMWESGFGTANFVFKQTSQQSSSQLQQINNQKQYSQPVYYGKMQKDISQNINPSPLEKKTQKITDSIIHVQPTKQSRSEEPDQQQESNHIIEGQNYKQQKSKEIESKDISIQSINKNNILQQQEQNEEIQYSPQSSIRKLYKNIKKQENKEMVSYVPKQQILIEQSSQSRSRVFYQEFDQQIEEDDISKKKQLRSNNLYDLVVFPVPKSKMIKCLVKVTNNKLLSLQSIFDLYLYEEKKHLLRGKKQRFRLFTNFEMLAKINKQFQAIAKVVSNFSRTEYKLIEMKRIANYKQRASKQKQTSESFHSNIIKLTPMSVHEEQITIIEKEDCYLAYQSNFLGFKQQLLDIIKLKTQIHKSDRFSDIKNSYENCQYQRTQKFSTKLAQKGPNGKLILDFKQKNLMDSNKNMIIEDQFGSACLTFAKTEQNLYILNIMHPFNIIQGFFLALCNLDRKIFVH